MHDNFVFSFPVTEPPKTEDDSVLESPEFQTRKVFRSIDELANRHRVSHTIYIYFDLYPAELLKWNSPHSIFGTVPYHFRDIKLKI